MMFNQPTNKHINISIFVIWLFHVSAIIGITLGYQQWFVSKTPLNLLIQAALLILCFPINTSKKLIVFSGCFLAGMLVEAIGVQYSFLFGNYYYGENLGFKVFDVPLLIGVNWAILVFVTAAIAQRLSKNFLKKIIIGATLMVVLDVVIEAVAPTFDFWYFTEGHPPIRNFISWFLVASFLHYVFQYFKLDGDFKFALNLYLAQFVFFGYFNLLF